MTAGWGLHAGVRYDSHGLPEPVWHNNSTQSMKSGFVAISDDFGDNRCRRDPPIAIIHIESCRRIRNELITENLYARKSGPPSSLGTNRRYLNGLHCTKTRFSCLGVIAIASLAISVKKKKRRRESRENVRSSGN